MLVADLTSADVLDRVGEATADLDIGLMVYNAGAVHGVARFLDQQVRDALYLIDLSCRGPVLWTHHFGRRLRARRSGGMVLMSSMSGLVGSALTVTYSATKAFDINLAEGLAVELAPYGVDVMAVIAGLTRTPTMVDSGARLEGFPMMEPDAVSEEALDALGTRLDRHLGRQQRAVRHDPSGAPRRSRRMDEPGCGVPLPRGVAPHRVIGRFRRRGRRACSAMAVASRWVFARGTVGATDASMMRKPSTFHTAHC